MVSISDTVFYDIFQKDYSAKQAKEPKEPKEPQIEIQASNQLDDYPEDFICPITEYYFSVNAR